MKSAFRIAAGTTVLSTLFLTPVAHAAKWQVLDLGLEWSATNVQLNNKGQVTGTQCGGVQLQPPCKAFVTDANGANRRDLYADNTQSSYAANINDAGQVLSARGADNNWEQHVSTPGAGTPAFKTVARSMYFYGLGQINPKGVVVGDGSPAAGTTYGYDAYIANADGSGYAVLPNEMDPIGATSTGVIVYSGVNNGWASVAKSATSPSVRLKAPAGTGFVPAYGMNDKGQVVGEYRPSDNMPHAYVTGANGTGFTAIGTLGAKLSDAFGVNTNGVVVGDFGNNADFWHAMITDAGGKNPRDLAAEVTLPDGGYLTSARGINDKGQVVAVNYYSGHAYLLTPVGESDCAVTYKRVVLSNKSVATQVTVANLTGAALTGWGVNWRIDTPSKVSSVTGAKVTTAPASGSYSGTVASAAPTNGGKIAANSQVSFSLLATALDGSVPTVAEISAKLGGQVCKIIRP